MSEYDFLIVGAGLYGATFARLATDDGYKCLVIDRRPNVAGNVYTEDVHGINVHKYGAHIFHSTRAIRKCGNLRISSPISTATRTA